MPEQSPDRFDMLTQHHCGGVPTMPDKPKPDDGARAPVQGSEAKQPIKPPKPSWTLKGL